MIPSLPVRQIAFFGEDVRAAALAHHRAHGSGPFFVGEHIKLARSAYRGRPDPVPLDHSSAYGQWGEVMVEFVQQNDNLPSAFHDLYPRGSGRRGMHHVALFVDDLPAAIADHEARGLPTALYAETASGFAFAMIDTTADYGFMTELYEPRDLLGFYQMVRDAAQGWDGRDPVRTLDLG